MKTDYDVTIIGAGPAGITAAIYLQRSNLNCCIIEKSAPGGLVNKTSIVENYPGFTKITGPDLAYKLYEQLNNSKIKQIFEEVIEITDMKAYKLVKTTNNEIKTKAVILAIGRTPKKLEKTNERSLEGKGISFCSLCDGALYKNEEVAELERKQEELAQKMDKMEQIMDHIEQDIYSDDGFDFEIVCPYCNYEFVIDVDENKTEIECPECNNIIELDWSGDLDDDHHGCSGSCSSCHGCGDDEEEDDEFEDDEDDDM